MDDSIDFVFPWVDGSDPAWLEQFHQYCQSADGDKSKSRFRDWGLLKYQFRSYEACLPWVRKIHFVTWGHLPIWLNIDHQKLNVVYHNSYIPPKYLPVFSSHPIEVNMHRIAGLANEFVYFNDDTYVLERCLPEVFFKKGLPRDFLAFNLISDSKIANIKINNIQVLHKYFDKYKIFKKNIFSIFNFRSSFIEMAKTILLMPWPKITGFYDHHMPQPFLKKTFEEVWALEEEILSKTSASRFRCCSDVNQYLFRYWHLCKGEFYPISIRRNRFEWVRNYEDAVRVHDMLLSGKYRMFCINDGVDDEDEFPRIKEKIISAFDKIFPNKSSFEI